MTKLPQRPRRTRLLALLLLVIQGLAGGAVSIAHASEPHSAPVHIEAQHRAECVSLHDELRCTLCHYAASTLEPEPTRTQSPAASRTEVRPAIPDAAPRALTDRYTAPPRAPPASRS